MKLAWRKSLRTPFWQHTRTVTDVDHPCRCRLCTVRLKQSLCQIYFCSHTPLSPLFPPPPSFSYVESQSPSRTAVHTIHGKRGRARAWDAQKYYKHECRRKKQCVAQSWRDFGGVHCLGSVIPSSCAANLGALGCWVFRAVQHAVCETIAGPSDTPHTTQSVSLSVPLFGRRWRRNELRAENGTDDRCFADWTQTETEQCFGTVFPQFHEHVPRR